MSGVNGSQTDKRIEVTPLPFGTNGRPQAPPQAGWVGGEGGGEAAPFDAVALDYDREFTDTALGRALRERVWRRLAARFPAGARVLELNCGTGEDAAWLARRGASVVATDQSEAMLDVARKKVAGLPVQFARLDLAAPSLESCDLSLETFDGAFSNFGGLNCVADLRPLARFLAACLGPGAPLVLVVMGPFCLWETGWNLLRGRPRAAARRWRRGGAAAHIGGQTVTVHYPRPGRLARLFAPDFCPLGLTGLGVALPPSLLAGAMERRRRLFRTLGAVEDRIARLWPFPLLADHYILELERCG